MEMKELREKCKSVREILMKDLKRGVIYSYTEGEMQFNIYINEYDYITIVIKKCEENIERIAEAVKDVYNNRYKDYYVFHKASILEKVVIDLINKSRHDYFYVVDGELRVDNSNLAWKLEDIGEYKISDTEDVMALTFEDNDGIWNIFFYQAEDMIGWNIMLDGEYLKEKDL